MSFKQKKHLLQGAGFGRHHPHTGLEAMPDARTGLMYNTRQFVAEDGWRHNHPGMIALLHTLKSVPHVSAALTRTRRSSAPNVGSATLSIIQIFGAVQNGRQHVSVTVWIH